MLFNFHFEKKNQVKRKVAANCFFIITPPIYCGSNNTLLTSADCNILSCFLFLK